MEGGEAYGDAPGEQEEPPDPPGKQGPSCGRDLLAKEGAEPPNAVTWWDKDKAASRERATLSQEALWARDNFYFFSPDKG